MDSRTTLFAALRAAPLYPRRTGLACAGVTAAGVLADLTLTGPEMALSGVGALGCTTAWWWVRQVMRPQGTRGHLRRESERIQRAGGVASWVDVQEVASPASLRSCARWLRPSMQGRWRPDPNELGVLVATVGTGRLPGQQVWSSCEDITLRVGGPRMGKSGSLICHGLDAPGALVTTSTKLDLAEGVHAARRDRAVHLMNLSGEGGVPSSVRWSILTGCDDYTTAVRRAADLLPAEGDAKDGLDWTEKAREVLGLLLHAAALDGRQARDVSGWMGAEQGTSAADRVGDILASVSRERADRWRQHVTEPKNTRGSVIATMRPALSWLSDDVARDLGDADLETTTLNVPRLILQGETLHIVGREDRSGTGPLVAAIVAEVAHQARLLAGKSPSGRLDPPVTFLLDEAAIICPVPLDSWSADFGGRNITLHVSIQSLAQMRARWGREGASTILGNVGTILVFGGSKDADDLRDLSVLTGEHRQRVLDADWKNEGDVEHRWVPVLSPAEISALRRFQVLVMKSGLHAVVGWAPQAKDRRGTRPAWLDGDPRLTGPVLRTEDVIEEVAL